MRPHILNINEIFWQCGDFAYENTEKVHLCNTFHNEYKQMVFLLSDFLHEVPDCQAIEIEISIHYYEW